MSKTANGKVGGADRGSAFRGEVEAIGALIAAGRASAVFQRSERDVNRACVIAKRVHRGSEDSRHPQTLTGHRGGRYARWVARVH